jgi:tetratricopeptide (TPR) repeat protein
VGAADCLAQALEDDGKPDEAEALFRMVIEKSRPRGEDQPRCLTANYHLLRNLAQRQKWEQIDEPGQAILRGLKTGSIAPLKAATYLATYAYGLRESKRYHEAEPLLLDARQRLIADGLTGNPLYPAVNRRLAEICDATGRPDEAARWRQEATPISKSTNPSAAP